MATLKSGWGYWQKANYANRFRRATADLAVELVVGCTHGGWTWIRLASGEVVETDERAIAREDA